MKPLFNTQSIFRLFVIVFSLAVLQGCPWESDDPAPAAKTYSIGGTITNLTGTGLVLQNNGGDSLEISTNGSFNFNTNLEDGKAYAVTILSQSSVVTCAVSNGSGTVNQANVSSIEVLCDSNPVGYFEGSGKFNYGAESILDLDGSATDKTKTVQAIVDKDTFAITSVADQLVYIGTFTEISGSSYTATVKIYKDGYYQYDTSVSGTIISRSTMSGMFKGDGDYASGTFDLLYSDVNKLPANTFSATEIWEDDPDAPITWIRLVTSTEFEFETASLFQPDYIRGCRSRNNQLVSMVGEQENRLWNVKAVMFYSCSVTASELLSFDMVLGRFDLYASDDRVLMVFYDDTLAYASILLVH